MLLVLIITALPLQALIISLAQSWHPLPEEEEDAPKNTSWKEVQRALKTAQMLRA